MGTVGTAGAATAGSTGGAGATAAAPVGTAADFFAAAFCGGFSGALTPPNDSRSRRATGASTVEDADLTNSPCSLRRASTSLLVTPSSLANSCTRALPATALLTGEAERAARYGLGLRPKRAHRGNFTVCSCLLLPVLSWAGCPRPSPTTVGGRSSLAVCEQRVDLVSESRLVHAHVGRPQCVGEDPAPHRRPQTPAIGMEPGTSSRENRRSVECHRRGDGLGRRINGHHRGEPNEFGDRGALTAADTRSHGAGGRQRSVNHRAVYRPSQIRCVRPTQLLACRHPSVEGAVAPAPSVGRTSAPSGGRTSASDRMSIRQPVRRAASRAFWPSLPIASDSW